MGRRSWAAAEQRTPAAVLLPRLPVEPCPQANRSISLAPLASSAGKGLHTLQVNTVCQHEAFRFLTVSSFLPRAIPPR